MRDVKNELILRETFIRRSMLLVNATNADLFLHSLTTDLYAFAQ